MDASKRRWCKDDTTQSGTTITSTPLQTQRWTKAGKYNCIDETRAPLTSGFCCSSRSDAMNAGFCMKAARVPEKPKDPRFDELA